MISSVPARRRPAVQPPRLRSVPASTSGTNPVEPRNRHAARRSLGRPTLLEPGVRELLLTAIRAGNRPAVAARYAGISSKTLDEWVRRGRGLDVRPPTPAYEELVADIERAQAEAQVYALGMIRKAMARDPRAAMWFLENTDPCWRQRRAPAPVGAEQSPPPSPAPTGPTIVITQEQLEAIALMQLEDGTPEGHDRLRIASLMEEYPSGEG